VFDVIETDASSEYFFACALADRSGFFIVMVDDVSDTTKILREVFTTGPFAVDEMDGLDDFDGGFLFFGSDLLHDDVIIGLAEVVAGLVVAIKHGKFNNKNYKCMNQTARLLCKKLFIF
jgi:hypothetical protein